MTSAGQSKRAMDWVLEFIRLGIQDFVVCPGSRNGAFVEAMALLAAEKRLQMFTHFDERAAGFFALGLSKESGRPAVVCVTSGTAVAELLPAVMEAKTSASPIWVLAADRPLEFRNTGAPQTIDHSVIFQGYADLVFDGPVQNEFPKMEASLLSRPLFFNVSFDEPVMDQDMGKDLEFLVDFRAKGVGAKAEPLVPPSWGLANRNGDSNSNSDSHGVHVPVELQKKIIEQISALPKPLVLVSGSFLQREPYGSTWLQSLSQLFPKQSFLIEASTGQRDQGLSCLSDKEVLKLFEAKVFESVLRVGDVPVHRIWRDLDGALKSIPVLHFVGPQNLVGLARNISVRNPQSLYSVDALLSEVFRSGRKLGLAKSQKKEKAGAFGSIAQSNCALNSEEQWIADLISQMAEGDLVYLGNSLPIRHFQRAWNSLSSGPNQLAVRVSRGANGIDGQISTFLGCAARHQGATALWCLVGDLTAMYDLNALHFLEQIQHKERLRVVVINNGGGRIFERFSKSPVFLNQHHFDFQRWAEAYQIPYLKIEEKSFGVRLSWSDPGPLVVEVKV